MDSRIAGLAQSKFVELRTQQTLAFEDTATNGKQFPPEYGMHMCEAARRLQQSQQQLRPKYNNDYHGVFGFMQVHSHQSPRHYQSDDVGKIRNDGQNVHDHAVVAAMKMNIDSLLKAGGVGHRQNEGDQSVQDDVRAMLFESSVPFTDREMDDALTVVDSLGHAKHSVQNVSEREVTRMVMDEIHKFPKDSQQRRDAIEALGKQLASGIEHGHVVCSTGKIARIMGTLDVLKTMPGASAVIQNIETTKPMWAVRQELAALATKVRERLSTAEYENGNRPDLEMRMKDEFERLAFAEYCDNLGMKRTVLEPIVQTYTEAF
jgi:hypothetical protein